jgi:hypothetical protein
MQGSFLCLRLAGIVIVAEGRRTEWRSTTGMPVLPIFSGSLRRVVRRRRPGAGVNVEGHRTPRLEAPSRLRRFGITLLQFPDPLAAPPSDLNVALCQPPDLR